MRTWKIVGLAALLASSAASAAGISVEEITVSQLQKAITDKRASCREIVEAHLQRIASFDEKGPALNAILTLNPRALARADELDAAFATSGLTGPLHCVPIVLKDNYNTADLPTTDGSASLAGMQPTKDAFVVAKLRQGGAVVLAKTNMHEFAVSGTTASSLGGQTLNPYDLTRTPGGSSGGTGAGLAASFAVLGTGSDTVNSIRSPASANNIVGFRPTRGLISRAGIAPVSETQDAIGPLARTVEDVARMLDVMQGIDPEDPATSQSQGKSGSNYLQPLSPDGLNGARIGVLRSMFGTKPEHEEVNRVMGVALDVMRKAGATVIEIDAPDLDAAKVGSSTDVQKYEFKPLLNAYLASIPNAPAKSLADIIASGKIHKASVESFLKGSEAVENGMQEPDYKARLQRIADTRKAVDRVFDENRLDALVYPLQRRLVVPVTELNQADRNGILASVTGLPALDIPVGFSAPSADAPVGVPIGMDLLGRAWSEAALLRIGYAFEQAAHVRKPPPSTPALSH
jgi:Asp-tRNA(Asn)/Glu-tRNA(Gln) amidotransferase A subunit family amidase